MNYPFVLLHPDYIHIMNTECQFSKSLLNKEYCTYCHKSCVRSDCNNFLIIKSNSYYKVLKDIIFNKNEALLNLRNNEGFIKYVSECVMKENVIIVKGC
jgi:hypothetical protein